MKLLPCAHLLNELSMTIALGVSEQGDVEAAIDFSASVAERCRATCAL